MSKKLQRPISVLTSITTIAWLSGVAMLAPLSVGAAVIDGDIVSPDAEFIEGDITYYPYDVFIVKIVGAKTFKRLILNPTVFDSYGHLEWGNIQTISASTVDGYTTSNLVREIDDTKVYKLTPDGDTGSKGWLNITVAEFETDGYDWDSIYIINATDRDNYTTGSNIGPGGVVDDDDGVSEGTLTVTLAADTPAAAIVVSSAARAPFTKINLTANGGNVIVDSMTLERGGLAQDGAFSSVAIILDAEDGTQHGTNKSFNSLHQTVIYDDLTITSGTTKTIYLSGNMGTISTTYAGETPILKLVAITLKDDATLNATLPIAGNAMTLNGTITIGTATIANGSNNPSTTTQNVGATNYIVSSVKVTNSSVEKITIRKLVFTQDGSADTSDVENIDLVNGSTGEVLDTVVTPASKTLVFTPNWTLGKGKNVSFDLRLDIINGSARTISYDIDQQTDILVKGDTYGYYITPTYTGSARPYYDAPDTTIGDGSLAIEAMSITPTNIGENQTDVLLGKFKFVAKGEEVKITSIGWNTEIVLGGAQGATTSDITNLTIYDEGGTAVAGPMTPTYDLVGDAVNKSRGAATTTATVIIPVGESIYMVKGDLSSDFLVGDTIQLSVLPRNVTARGMTTDNAVVPTPSADVTSSVLTVKPASLTVTVSTEPAAQTVIGGTQDFVFAKYLFDATNSGSGVKISQVKVPLETSGSAYPDLVSGIGLWLGDTELSWSTYSEDSNWDSTAANSATTTITLEAGQLVLSAGSSKIVTVKANIGTGATSGTLSIGIQENGVTATDMDGNSFDETCTGDTGSTMTLAQGGTINLDVLTDPSSALVIAGSEVVVGKFTMQAKYEDININHLGITEGTADDGILGDKDEVTSIALYEEGVAEAIGSIEFTADKATITPSSILTVPSGESKTYSLKATFANISDITPATSGSGVRFTVSNVDATGVSAGSSTVTINGTDSNFNTFSVYKSVPIFTQLAFSGSDTITANSQVVSLYKFKIKASDVEPLSLYKFTFVVATTVIQVLNDVRDPDDTTGFYLYMSDSESSLGSAVSKGGGTKNDIAMQYMTADSAGISTIQLETWFDVANDTAATATEQIIINAGDTKYFTLRATIKTGHTATVDDEAISTSVIGDAGFAHDDVLNADGIDAKQNGHFIWSDLNADRYATSTATVTAMFFNGYRISGLDTTTSTSQVITD